MTTPGPVLVVGAGLLGTSVALACERAGVEVWLSDLSDDHLRTATGLGAGRRWDGVTQPALVVVAVPPDHVAAKVTEMLERTEAVVTDVCSVKAGPLAAIDAHRHAARYVGGHPMAGSERSGPLAASASLFEGRPWAITPRHDNLSDSVQTVRALAEGCGAVVVEMSPAEHDSAVARVSHLPHLMSVLMADRLSGAPSTHLELAGQGVRDVTRIAGSDPGLWEQILSANSQPIGALLAQVRERLDAVLEALGADDRAALGNVLGAAVSGARAIPGKHNAPLRPTETVVVAIPDHPGELGRLFAEMGRIAVNIEDVRIDHDPGRPVGLVELEVEQSLAERTVAALSERGWSVHR